MVKVFRNHWSPAFGLRFPSCFEFRIIGVTETLESPALRIELNTAPYSYRVIERSAKECCCRQSSTGVTFGPELYPVSERQCKQDVKQPAG